MTIPWWAAPGFVLTVCVGVAAAVLAAHRKELTRRDLLLGAVAALVPFGWVVLLLRLDAVRALVRRVRLPLSSQA